MSGLREALLRGQVNLLFGLAFGISFALQTARLGRADAAQATNAWGFTRPRRVARTYAAASLSCSSSASFHARLLWSGDVFWSTRCSASSVLAFSALRRARVPGD